MIRPSSAAGSPLAAAPIDAVAATDTLTSNNTNVTAGNTVTIDGVVFTFVGSLTPLEGEVLRGGSADASLTNLVSAINHAGTPGTDYSVAAAHATVSAAAVSSHATVLSARTKGTAGNAITLARVGATLSVAGATFSGGINGTPGNAGQIGVYSGVAYVCMADATIATSGSWKKVTTEAL